MKTLIRFLPSIMLAGFVVTGVQLIGQDGSAKGGGAKLIERRPAVVCETRSCPAMSYAQCASGKGAQHHRDASLPSQGVCCAAGLSCGTQAKNAQ